MTRNANNVWVRVGFDPEERLRWLLRFGSLDRETLKALTVAQRDAITQEVRAFAIFQELDPALRGRLRSFAPPNPSEAMANAPTAISDSEVWRAQQWLKRGLEMLGRAEKWNFSPQVSFQIDAHGGLLWTRMKTTSRLNQFKALTFEAFRDARFRFRLCPHCRRAFVPIKRQAYCSARCSQAVRTRKWRTAHPERNRAIRRAQYQKSVAAKLKLSRTAKIRIAKRRRSSRD